MNQLLTRGFWTERNLVYTALASIIIFFSPYFILGEQSHILIHDNLDSGVTHVKILLNNHAAFASPDTKIDSALNGLPLSMVYPYYDFSLIVFVAFGVFWGYVVNKILISLIGFFGMYLLLKHHVIKNDADPMIIIAVSLLYALLPFWSFMASVSGLPFALYAFLNFRQPKAKFHNWLIVVLYPFYSSLVMTGIFLLVVLAFVWVYDLVRTRNLNITFVLAGVLLVTCYLVSHYPLIATALHGPISHRIDFQRDAIGFSQSLRKAWVMLQSGQYHAHSLHTWMILPIALSATILPVRFRKKFLMMAIFIALSSTLYGFKDYQAIKGPIDIVRRVIPAQFDRFHFLNPMFWYVLLAICLRSINEKFRFGGAVVAAIMVLQFTTIVRNHELLTNRRKPNYHQFYSTATFEKVKSVIAEPVENYRVISVGLHPAVAQYSGFYTLDGYFPSYPATYRNSFKDIIDPELKRDKQWRKKFENWGSRCYAFSSENHEFTENDGNKIDSLNYNYDALITLRGKFILSSSYIDEKINTRLELVDKVTAQDEYWTIYVYRVLN